MNFRIVPGSQCVGHVFEAAGEFRDVMLKKGLSELGKVPRAPAPAAEGMCRFGRFKGGRLARLKKLAVGLMKFFRQ
jgi:hypothetical protein